MYKIGREKTAAKKRTGTKMKKIIANRYIYFMLIPVIVYYLVFHYVPMYGLSFAFRSFKPGSMTDFLFGGKWMGFEYFSQIFSDALFYRAVKNTMILSCMKLVILFPFTILIVLMLNELRIPRFKKLTQTVTYLPHFFSWVIIGGIIVQLLSSNGAVTNLIKLITGKDVLLLSSKTAFRWILLISTAFKETGWDTIIYISALSGISAEYYEAAECDGANRLQRVIHITLPCLLPTICIMLLMKISFMINGDFDQVYVMYNSSVYEVADIIETYIYRLGISDGKFGMSTAVGLVKSVISGSLLLFSNKISKKLTGHGMY